ncbi:MAG: EAL domain-containing protein [Methylococcaceae bacterium]
MLQIILDIFGAGGLIPHGFCINWTQGLLWLYVASDALIALSYYSIPVALAYFVGHRKDLKCRWIFLMFGACILACGTTHLLSIIILWQPLYWLDAQIKAITAVISIITAALLVKVIPEALCLPSLTRLHAEIDEHSKAQLALQESEYCLRVLHKQLTHLIEAIPDPVFLKDGEGRWLVANEFARQLFQLHDVDWLGKTNREIADQQFQLRAKLEKCLIDEENVWKAGKLAVFEERITDETGSCREYEVRKSPIFKENGERIGLVTIARDITDSRQAEHSLRIADTAIESQDGIVITDADNSILRINSAFTKLTGYSAKEVIGKKPAILKSGRHDKSFYRAMWKSLTEDKFWQGEIWDRHKNGEIYPKWLTINAVTEPGGQVTNYVAAFTDLTEHKEAKEAIHRLAFYDPLTDLPNRRLLRDRLQLALSSSAHSHHYGAALMVDLDNFKAINDTKGHSIGDQLLIEVAQRLKSCVRQGDTVARLGGDEFVIMLENLSADSERAITQATGVGHKILEVINQPFLLAGYEHHSSPSIGICLFIERDISVNEIFKRADAAMYQAKNSGRNTLCFFDPDMQASLETRMTMKSELHHALPRNQLKLYYQVQITNTGQVLGAETLLRWQHPQRGLICPDQFIPLAEESGLIIPIGDWVLRTACMQLKVWQSDVLTRDLVLAVNVSSLQFRQPEFVERIRNILDQTGINATRLKLELTESLVIHNIAETIEKMEALKKLGIRFSLDDFGTGYSSLSYLTKLPLSQLKIDRSFVRDIVTDQNDAIIIQTIIGMANNLGLSVIAEGVETKEQLACLESFGCLAYQGHLFSKPVPLEEFEQLISQTMNLEDLV